MQALFNPDSKLMRCLSRLGDLVILNLLFLLTSLPVFTIGASLTAMNAVCFRYDTDREDGTVRPYFAAFRANFKQATCLWVILLVCILSACFNTAFFYVMPGWMHLLFVVFAILGVLALMISAYSFALLSRFDNTCRDTLRNALIMSIAYLPRSIAMAAMDLLPFFLLLTDLYLFFRVGFLWAFLYFAAAAYGRTKLLRSVFLPFEEEEEV